MKHLSLQRLRSHGGTGGTGGPPMVHRAERSSDTDGVIDFGWGRCVLRATDTDLLLRAEADDEPHLRRIEDGIAARLQRIGRRDGLSVSWTRGNSS